MFRLEDDNSIRLKKLTATKLTPKQSKKAKPKTEQSELDGWLPAMPFHVDDSVGCQVRLLEKLRSTALAKDAHFLAKITMQVQTRCRRDETQNLTLLVEQGIRRRRLVAGVNRQ